MNQLLDDQKVQNLQCTSHNRGKTHITVIKMMANLEKVLPAVTLYAILQLIIVHHNFKHQEVYTML